jgi:hypothetical protein
MDRRAGRRAALSFLWFQDFAIHGFYRLVLFPWRRIVVAVRRQPMVFGTRPGLIAGGQTLNLSVFYRLGKSGVFTAIDFGHQVPWCRGFPFSLFKHPQYAGMLLSIWGFFLVVRFPTMVGT